MEENSFELKFPTHAPAPLKGKEARAGQGRGCTYCQGSASYTCPRCSVNYCGLKCYQSEAHRECSEGFYKECVERELHGQGLGEESKKKMQDILQRVHRKEEEEEEEDVMDSDDEEEAEELEKRLEGVDLEDTSKVWSSLTKEEKRQFQEMVTSGELVGLMPEYKPWWKHRVALKKIVEVGEEEELDETLKMSCPTVCENIPGLRNVMKNPSSFIKFGLLNLLYGYAYAVKFFNGDYSAVNGAHFVEIIQLLASTLDGQNFDLADTAVEAAASEVNNHQWLTVSLEHSRNVKKDVYELVKGPTGEDNFYILAALSDMKAIFEATVKDLKKSSKSNKNIELIKAEDEEELPAWLSEKQQKPELELTRVRKHLKKIEFYLSWTQDFYEVFKEL